jgi:hypothetical protein
MEAHKIDIKFSCGKSKMDTTTLIINMKLSTSSTEKKPQISDTLGILLLQLHSRNHFAKIIHYEPYSV